MPHGIQPASRIFPGRPAERHRNQGDRLDRGEFLQDPALQRQMGRVEIHRTLFRDSLGQQNRIQFRKEERRIPVQTYTRHQEHPRHERLRQQKQDEGNPERRRSWHRDPGK